MKHHDGICFCKECRKFRRKMNKEICDTPAQYPLGEEGLKQALKEDEEFQKWQKKLTQRTTLEGPRSECEKKCPYKTCTVDWNKPYPLFCSSGKMATLTQAQYDEWKAKGK